MAQMNMIQAINSALDINSTISRTNDTIRSTTGGAINGSAATDGDQSVDRNSGRVEARRNAELAGAANVGQLASTPIAPFGGSASGSGSASGNGEAQAQLIGTDTFQSVAGNVVGQAQGAAGTAQGFAAPIVGSASDTATSLPSNLAMTGSTNGEGSASGEGSANLMTTPLAVAGSVAGAAGGAATITPGMPVVTPSGVPIGEVEQIVANSQGEVEEVIVSNSDVTQTIPAGNLAASGNALVAGSGNANAGTESTEDEPA